MDTIAFTTILFVSLFLFLAFRAYTKKINGSKTDEEKYAMFTFMVNNETDKTQTFSLFEIEKPNGIVKIDTDLDYLKRFLTIYKTYLHKIKIRGINAQYFNTTLAHALVVKPLKESIKKVPLIIPACDLQERQSHKYNLEKKVNIRLDTVNYDLEFTILPKTKIEISLCLSDRESYDYEYCDYIAGVEVTNNTGELKQVELFNPDKEYSNGIQLKSFFENLNYKEVCCMFRQSKAAMLNKTNTYNSIRVYSENENQVIEPILVEVGSGDFNVTPMRVADAVRCEVVDVKFREDIIIAKDSTVKVYVQPYTTVIYLFKYES
jgi:hypothetical protein